jgi:hypothetical protein
MKIILLIIISFILTSTSCHKKKYCQRNYIFENPTSIFPIQSSYNIGDTLWYELDFTNDIKDVTTGEIIKLENFDFMRNFIHFERLHDSTTSVVGQEANSGNSFDYIVEKGQIVHQYSHGPEYKLAYYDNSYHLKIGIIMKETGRYSSRIVFQNNVLPPGNSKIVVKGECEDEYLQTVTHPMNRQTDGTYQNNYNIYSEFMNISLENDPDYIKQQSFFFIVN